jgi:FtsZ-interacting cell division protein ZipA
VYVCFESQEYQTCRLCRLFVCWLSYLSTDKRSCRDTCLQNDSAADDLLQTSIPMAAPVAPGQTLQQFVRAQAVPVGQVPQAMAVPQQQQRQPQTQVKQQMVQAQAVPVTGSNGATAVPQQQARPLQPQLQLQPQAAVAQQQPAFAQVAAASQQRARQPQPQLRPQAVAAPAQQQVQPHAAFAQQPVQPRVQYVQPQLVTKNAAAANGQAFPGKTCLPCAQVLDELTGVQLLEIFPRPNSVFACQL